MNSISNQHPGLGSNYRRVSIGLMGLVMTSIPGLPAERLIQVDATQNLHPINPWIYGTNFDGLSQPEGITFRRAGGNRMTGYNWENNASSAGSDWLHSSDNYLGGGLIPGKVISDFHEKSLTLGAASLVTLEAAGFVARDKKGAVSVEETAPSSRWVPIQFSKGAAFSETPDTNDNQVFMDEQVAFLVKKFGMSHDTKGIRAYAIDNEPALWPFTHPRIHPDTTTCQEITSKNNSLAAAVKAIDPQAEIFGGVFFGYSAFDSFGSAKDWDSIKTAGKYGWFIDYFLDAARKASEKSGRRLIDVIDLHWYSEAQGDHRITDASATSAKDIEARLQAPRTLWDTTYTESSWISQWATPKQPVTNWNNPTPGPIGLLPHLFSSIKKYYPGTKVAFTEWNYGGPSHISGGLATADVLGVFGREGVYASNFWPLNDTVPYIQAAYRLFRNADGKGLAFGTESNPVRVDNDSILSAFSSFNPEGKDLHLIVLNKSSQPVDGKISVTSPVPLNSGHAYGFDASSSNLTDKGDVGPITGNAFTATLPPLSATHFVLQASSPFPSVHLFTPQSGKTRVSHGNQRSPAQPSQWIKVNGHGVRLNGSSQPSYPSPLLGHD